MDGTGSAPYLWMLGRVAEEFNCDLITAARQPAAESNLVLIMRSYARAYFTLKDIEVAATTDRKTALRQSLTPWQQRIVPEIMGELLLEL